MAKEMKSFYASVIVTERRELKVLFELDSEPLNAEMLDMLQNEEYEDITDEETLEILSVESVEIIQDEGD